MKKSNNLREIWSDLKFLFINKCLFGQVFGSTSTEGKVRVGWFMFCGVTHYFGSPRTCSGSLCFLFFTYCWQPVVDRYKSIAPQITADATVLPSIDIGAITSSNHSVRQCCTSLLPVLLHHSQLTVADQQQVGKSKWSPGVLSIMDRHIPSSYCTFNWQTALLSLRGYVPEECASSVLHCRTAVWPAPWPTQPGAEMKYELSNNICIYGLNTTETCRFVDNHNSKRKCFSSVSCNWLLRLLGVDAVGTGQNLHEFTLLSVVG